MQSSELNTDLMDVLTGFLSFEIFISPAILMLTYYLGAIVFPLLIYKYVYRNVKKIPSFKLPEVDQAVKHAVDRKIEDVTGKFSTKWIFLLAFITVEIFWRMFIEFIIAYFQIREALMSFNI